MGLRTRSWLITISRDCFPLGGSVSGTMSSSPPLKNSCISAPISVQYDIGHHSTNMEDEFSEMFAKVRTLKGIPGRAARSSQRS